MILSELKYKCRVWFYIRRLYMNKAEMKVALVSNLFRYSLPELLSSKMTSGKRKRTISTKKSNVKIVKPFSATLVVLSLWFFNTNLGHISKI